MDSATNSRRSWLTSNLNSREPTHLTNQMRSVTREALHNMLVLVQTYNDLPILTLNPIYPRRLELELRTMQIRYKDPSSESVNVRDSRNSDLHLSTYAAVYVAYVWLTKIVKFLCSARRMSQRLEGLPIAQIWTLWCPEEALPPQLFFEVV